MSFPTLAEVRQDVRSHLDEKVQNFWDDTTELDVWIYEAAREVARRTQTLQDYHSYTAEAGVPEYDLPDDLVGMHHVEFRRTASNVTPVEYVPFRTFTNHRSNPTAQGTPSIYTIWGSAGTGGKLIVYRAPSEEIEDGLRAYYYRFPRKPQEADDPIEVPSGWQDLIPLYVEVVARRKDGMNRQWAEALQLFEARLERMYSATRHWSDQPAYISSGGSLHWSQGNPWLD